jgi:hypothetical protein
VPHGWAKLHNLEVPHGPRRLKVSTPKRRNWARACDSSRMVGRRGRQNEKGGSIFWISASLVILSRRAARAVSKELREAISVSATLMKPYFIYMMG